jgi:large subunit ribosomal protein L3
MAGHMGAEKSTILNLQVVKTIPEKDLLLIKGSVPGGPNGLLIILNKTVANSTSN